ncbi:MAG TPA: hypothetical protein VF541_03725 [Longimicrobium sp.]
MDAQVPTREAIPVPALAGGPGALQFDTAAPAAAAASKACTRCTIRIDDVYHMAYGRVICSGCRGRLEAAPAGSAFARVLTGGALGFGAAVVGGLAAWGIGALTHMYVGYVYVGVGLLVGRAVVEGGHRGRGYQVLAALLAYLAVGVSYAPLMGQALSSGTAAVPPAIAWVIAAVASVVTPVLALADDPLSGLFLLIAMVAAWRQPKAPELLITGPYHIRPPQPAPAPAP